MKQIAFLATAMVLITACSSWGLSDSASTDVESILINYKEWELLTPQPRNISALLASLCRMPTPEESAFLDSEHGGRYLSIYVNEEGVEAMAQQGERLFPVGSIIVKEKLLLSGDTSPEAIGIMIKHEKGFNPEGGDWEYVYWEQGGKLYSGSDKLSNCQSCHMGENIPLELQEQYELSGLWVSQQGRDSVFLTLPVPENP